MLGYPTKDFFRVEETRKCWCGNINTIKTISHHNGTPKCSCGADIKNPPQEWKKN